jgi:general secretion pathway protein D
LKTVSNSNQDYFAAEWGLAAVLSAALYFCPALPAQTVPSPAPPVAPAPAVRTIAPAPTAPAAPPLNADANQVRHDQAKQDAFRKLHQARQAVAVRDIAAAQRLVDEVQALRLSFAQNEDRPELVLGLIQRHNRTMEMFKTQGESETFRREYALLHLIQADTMVRRGELQLALQLTQEAARQQTQYTQPEKESGLDPASMFRRIEDARRVQTLNAPVPVRNQPAPLSQAAQEHLNQAIRTLGQAREALNTGQIEQAERLAQTAAGHQLPENVFPAGNSPSRLLAEIAAIRRGIPANPANPPQNPPAGQPAGQPTIQPSDILQTSANTVPALAPPIPMPMPVPNRNVPLVDQHIRNQQAVVSQISSEIMQQIADAQKMSREQRKPQAGLEILEKARHRVEQSPLDNETKNSFLTQIDRAVGETISFMERYEAQSHQDRVNAAVWEERRKAADAFRDKEQQLTVLFSECKKLMEDERFEEALRLAKKAQSIAPDEPAAAMLVTTTQLVYNLHQSIANRDAKADGFLAAMHAVDTAAVMPDFRNGSLIYGTDWSTLSKRRRASNEALLNQRPESERQILRKLTMPITVDEDQQITLEQALRKLCAQAGIPVFIDEAALREENILSGTPIKVPQANGIKLQSMLNVILEQHGLAYVVKDEILKITSRKKAKGEMFVKRHYVGDLVTKIPRAITVNENPNLLEGAYEKSRRNHLPPAGRANVPQPHLPADLNLTRNEVPPYNPNIAAQTTGTGTTGTSSGTGTNIGNTTNENGTGGLDFSSVQNIIESLIEPESWTNDDTGSGAKIVDYEQNMSLVIRQTEEAHAQIEDLLTQLRKMNDLQVAVEVRYITVHDNFFESIGMDFDLVVRNDNVLGSIRKAVTVFPSGESGSSSDTSSSSSSNTGGYKGNNVVVGLSAANMFSMNASIPFTQDSIGYSTPQFGPYDPSVGLQTGFALLSDIETYFFLKAAQSDQRTSVMQAPKVIIYNGQMGTISDTTSSPFVTGVNPVVGDFAIGYQPIITVLNEGQVLNVQAVVSHDRQHVRLTLNPTFTTIRKVQTFKYFGNDDSTEETATNEAGDDLSNTSVPGLHSRDRSTRRTTSSSGIVVQQPIMGSFTVSSTVNCPDGGTALLGGIKRLSEGRVEAGTPILNKLPYIQRLFSNVGIGRDTQSIMMMVTPRIIIQEEEEEFILGRSIP